MFRYLNRRFRNKIYSEWLSFINMSPPSVNDTVNGDVNVNIGVPKLSNGNVSGHAFTLIFNDGGHQTS